MQYAKGFLLLCYYTTASVPGKLFLVNAMGHNAVLFGTLSHSKAHNISYL